MFRVDSEKSREEDERESIKSPGPGSIQFKSNRNNKGLTSHVVLQLILGRYLT